MIFAKLGNILALAQAYLAILVLAVALVAGIQYSHAFSHESLYEWGSFGISETSAFSHPQFIDVDESGSVYVTDYGNKRVQKFDAHGDFVLEWGSSGRGDGQFHYPTGIASDGSHVYVVDRDLNRIQKFTHNGTYVSEWGERGRSDGQLILPDDIAIHNGSAYVVDTGNYRVQKFTTDGEFVLSFGSSGTDAGEFLTPRGIHVDGNGTVYVTDKGNGKIEVFDSDGTNLSHFSFIGRDKFMPGGIYADATGGLYVTDVNQGGLYYFESGLDLTIFPPSYLVTPSSSSARYVDVAIGENGELYAVDAFNHAVHAYSTPSYVAPPITPEIEVDPVEFDEDAVVTDMIRPVLTPPSDVVADADDLYTVLSIEDAVATDEGGIHAILNNAPDKFPMGVTIITWFAFDNAGNMAEAHQYVTVLACGESHSNFNMIRGTMINETLAGTEGRDLIFGLGGNDSITGGSGDDCIFGGDGADTILGGSGHDTIFGNAGDDIIRGELGSDTIDGGLGTDIVDAGPGSDSCSTHAGNPDILANCES